MSGETATAIAIVGAAAFAQVASQPIGAVNDIQLVAVATGAGLFGGLVATLMADEAISRRGLAKRMLASGMIAPALIIGAILHFGITATWAVTIALAGPAGLVAWPLWEQVPSLVKRYLPRAVAKRLGDDGGD